MAHRKGPPRRVFTPNHRGPLPFIFALSPVFFVAFLLSGCASPGEPSERTAPVPQAVTDLAAQQAGNSVILTFALPSETVNHRPLKQLPTIELYRIFGGVQQGGSNTATPAAARGISSPVDETPILTIPSSLVDHYAKGDRVRIEDALKAEDFTQHPGGDVTYGVRTRASLKKESPPSNLVSLHIYPAADQIDDARAEVTHDGVVLTWSPPKRTLAGAPAEVEAYHIYRAEAPAETAVSTGRPPASKAPLVQVGESKSESWTDPQVAFGSAYEYSVRSVVNYPDKQIESGDSNLVAVRAKDTFPPATPQGILVVPVPATGELPAHLELSWAISPETDVAGYNVYRSEQAGAPGTRLNTQLLLTPAFRDMNVESGRQYFYSVTASDRSGNESPPSDPVSGVVQTEGPAKP